MHGMHVMTGMFVMAGIIGTWVMRGNTEITLTTRMRNACMPCMTKLPGISGKQRIKGLSGMSVMTGLSAMHSIVE